MKEIVTLPVAPKRALCEAIFAGLSEWVQAEARQQGKEDPYVALDTASRRILERAVEIMREAAIDRRIVGVNIAGDDIARIVRNPPNKVRHRLRARLALVPKGGDVRYAAATTEAGRLYVRPVLEDREGTAIRLRPQVVRRKCIPTESDPLPTLDATVPLTPHPEDLLPPERRAQVLTLVSTAVELSRGDRLVHRVTSEFLERLRRLVARIGGWIPRRTRQARIEVVEAGRIEVEFFTISTADGTTIHEQAAEGDASDAQLEDDRWWLKDRWWMEGHEDEEVPEEEDGLVNIRAILESQYGSKADFEVWTERIGSAQILVRSVAEIVARNLFGRGCINTDSVTWIQAELDAAWQTMNLEAEAMRDHYMPDVWRRLGIDPGLELLRHARIAAIAHHELLSTHSEARHAVVEAARELDRVRRIETMPRPLNLHLDDWIEVLIRLESALSRCDARFD
jgi:hypothetical protein